MKIIHLIAALLISGLATAQNTFSYKTKNAEVVLLCETQRDNNINNLIGATPEILAETAPDKKYPGAVNAFLVKTKKREILLDAGYGRELFNNLKVAGVAPEDIDAVLMTHLHGDHFGGLLKDGKRAFPNAKLYMSKKEFASANESAAKAIKEYGDDLILFEPGESKPKRVFDALSSMSSYGHTPGHTVYIIDDLVIWGDLTHAMAIQMPYPQVAITYDTDPAAAVQSRFMMLSYIVRNNLKAAGMHVPYPGIGSLKTDGKGGYIFTPVK